MLHENIPQISQINADLFSAQVCEFCGKIIFLPPKTNHYDFILFGLREQPVCRQKHR